MRLNKHATKRVPVFDGAMRIGVISDTHGLLRPEALQVVDLTTGAIRPEFC
jgi:hypothetical protein